MFSPCWSQRVYCTAAGFLLLTVVLTWLVVQPSLAAPSSARPEPKIETTNPSQDLRDEIDKRERLRALPAKQQARRASRQSHRGLGRQQARDLAVSKFGPMLERELWNPLSLRPGDTLKSYRGEMEAVVKSADGSDTLLQGTLPLRSRVGTGTLEPVDLELERSGEGFAVKNPLVKTIIDRDVRQGVRIGEMSVGLEADGQGDAPLTVENKAYFANVATDTDLVLEPAPTGVLAAWVVRSAASPESATLDLELPAGERLVLSETLKGAVEIKNGDKIMGLVQAPVAQDADGTDVPVSYDIDGDKLLVRFAHRDRDLAYPLRVDPYFDRYRVNEDGSRVPLDDNVFAGWTAANAGSSFVHALIGQFGNGLYIATADNVYYGDRHWGRWQWFVPSSRSQTYISRADFGYVNHNWSFSCLVEGTFRGDGTNWETGTWYQPTGFPQADYSPSSPWFYDTPAGTRYGNGDTRWPCTNHNANYKAHVPSAPTNGNSVIFGLQTIFGAVRNPRALAYMYGAVIHLEDRQQPTTQGVTAPTAWIDQGTVSGGARATDGGGLGVRYMDLLLPNGPHQRTYATNAGSQTTSELFACTGSLYRNACPMDAGLFFNIAGSSIASEGVVNVPGKAYDVLGKAADFNIPVKVDHGKPVVGTPTGLLYEARDKFVGPARDWQFTVTATDGSTASAATQRSGVTSIRATLDGQPMTDGTNSVACARPEGSCALSVTPKLTGAAIAELDENAVHTVRITATDAVGQESEPLTFSFRIDAEAPASVASGKLAGLDADQGANPLTQNSYTTLAEASDNGSDPGDDPAEGEELSQDAPGSGTESLILKIDGQQVTTQPRTPPTGCVADPGCEKALSYTWNTTSVPNGTHTLELIATDKVGNVDNSTWTVDVQHPVPQPPRSSDVVRTITGTPSMRAGTSVAAIGDMNTDGHADYIVGAPGETVNGKAGAGAAYIVTGDPGQQTTDLSAASAGVRRISGPSAASDPNGFCGTSVASAGDVNGDEIGDFLIGCPGLNVSSPLTAGLAPTTGKVYVVFGSSNPQDADLGSLGDKGFVVNGPSEPAAGLAINGLLVRPAVFGERLTSSADSGQDINGDGLRELVIPDARSNAVYVIYGRSETSPVNAASLGSAGYQISGPEGTLFGYSAAIVDDINSDAVADVIVGAPGSTNELLAGTGSAFIVPGRVDQATPVTAATDQSVIKLASGVSNDRFGVSVAGLGDTDLDGRADFAVATKSGAYVVRDTPTTSKTITAADGYAITSAAVNTGAGYNLSEAPVAPAGDIDGDMRNDLVIGYPDAGDRRAYTILSPEGSDTIAASAALAGQYGSGAAPGTAAERSGSAVGANGYLSTDDNQVAENAQAIIGASTSSSGSAYIVQERVAKPPAPVTGPSQTAARSIQTGNRYRISRDDRATVRHWANSLVIGNAPQGTYQDVSSLQYGSSYGLVEHINRCAWLPSKNTFDEANPGGGFSGRCSGRRGFKRNYYPKNFASLINCDPCTYNPDRGETPPRGSDGKFKTAGGTDVDTRRFTGDSAPGWGVYANFNPGGTRSGFQDRIGYLKQGATVAWRYITVPSKVGGGRTVTGAMVFVTGSDLQSGLADSRRAWAFIPSAALPPKFGQNSLCRANNGIPASKLKYKGNYRFVDGKPVWPVVCAREYVRINN